jgi:hypothetical protein
MAQGVAAAVYPAMAVSAYLAVAVAVAPEEMVEVERLLTEEEVVVVAPSSMVETVMTTQAAAAHISAAAQAAS